MNSKIRNGLLTTATAIFLTGCATHDAPKVEANVGCAGINACKGQGACFTADNPCGGHNKCKGLGITKVATNADCTAQGGKVIELSGAQLDLLKR